MDDILEGARENYKIQMHYHWLWNAFMHSLPHRELILMEELSIDCAEILHCEAKLWE